ncbi:cupin domain-containing protein [candidate division KSB1 bacterium]
MTGPFFDFDGIQWEQVEPGVKRKVTHRGNLMVALIEIAPGKSFPPHHHPHEQVGYVLSGRILAHMGDQTREIGPGEGYITSPDLPHTVEILGDKPALLLDVFTPIREDFL